MKLATFILTGLFFYTYQMQAQTFGYVKGIVSDKANSETLPGALITIDKNQGISTDLNGHFIIIKEAGEHE